jgi:hypothetical protein
LYNISLLGFYYVLLGPIFRQAAKYELCRTKIWPFLRRAQNFVKINLTLVKK